MPCAYAWRQMVFHLSLAPPPDVEQFFRDVRPDEGVAPLLAGLERSHRRDAAVAPFLGWVVTGSESRP